MVKLSKQLRAIKKELEIKIKSNHPSVLFNWVMPLVYNSDGSGGGQLKISLPGFSPKKYLVYVNKNGSWYTQ